MSIVPSTRLGKIQFYEARIGPWTSHAGEIGLEDQSTSDLAMLITQARAAYNAAEAARAAAKAATLDYYNKVRLMHSSPGAGSDMISTIRNFAQTTNNPNVYVLAQIPAPATPGTVPPPGTPFDFRINLLQDGSLELRWKCNNPKGSQGTIYEVTRRLGGSGPFTFVGASGSRSLVDDTLPIGSAPVTYQITAVRSTSRGNPAQYTVNFGTGGGGGLAIASITQDEVEFDGGGGLKQAA